MMQSSSARVAHHPVIELDALLRDYLLGLVLIAGGGGDASSRAVQWVHSSDLIDPTPFLTPRTVLLTTGTQFVGVNEAVGAPAAAPTSADPLPEGGPRTGEDEGFSQEDALAYVQRLLDAGVTALGIAVGVRWERIPPTVIEACDRLHLPLFRVPYDTPFIAVVRTAVRLLEAESHAAERRSEKAQDHARAWGSADRRERLLEAENALRRAILDAYPQADVIIHKDVARR